MKTIPPITFNEIAESEQKIIDVWNKVISATNKRQYVEVLQFFSEMEKCLEEKYEDFITGLSLPFFLRGKLDFLTTTPEYQKTLDTLHLLMPDIFSCYEGEHMPFSSYEESPHDIVNKKLTGLQHTISSIFKEKRQNSPKSLQIEIFQESTLINNYLAQDLLLQYRTLFEQWEDTLLVTPEDKITVTNLNSIQNLLSEVNTAKEQYKSMDAIFEKNFAVMSEVFSYWNLHNSHFLQTKEKQEELTEASQKRVQKADEVFLSLSAAESGLYKKQQTIQTKISKLEKSIQAITKSIETKHKKIVYKELSLEDYMEKTKGLVDFYNKRTKANEESVANIKEISQKLKITIKEKRQQLQAIYTNISKLEILIDEKISQIEAINFHVAQYTEKHRNDARNTPDSFINGLQEIDKMLTVLHENKTKMVAEKNKIEKIVTTLTKKTDSFEEECLKLAKQNIQAINIKLNLIKSLQACHEIQDLTGKKMKMENRISSFTSAMDAISNKLQEANERKLAQKLVLEQQINNHEELAKALAEEITEKGTPLSGAEDKLEAVISAFENSLFAIGHKMEYSTTNLPVSNRYEQIMEFARNIRRKEALDSIEKTPECVPALVQASKLEKQLQETTINNTHTSTPQRLALIFNAKRIIDNPALSITEKVETLNKDLKTLKTAQQNTLSQQETSFLTQAGLLLGCLVLVTPIACAISKVTRGSWAFWKSSEEIHQSKLCKETADLLKNAPVPAATIRPAAAA